MSEVKVNKISPRTACGTVTVGDSGDSVSVSAGVPVTVNGDLKSNALKATDGGVIISQSGTTITLGASGDTVSLASGASQTGFGRTGTVNWDTTIKTADFTATSGSGFFVNTGGGSNITVTLPASPSAGDIVSVADYGGTAATNNIIIARNGSNIEGGTTNISLTTNRDAITLIFADSTQGWIPVNDNTGSSIPPEFVAATGGTVKTCGNFKTHIFTGPGTLCVSSAGNGAGSNTVDYFVLAGGGGVVSGGGGAGGFRVSNSAGCVPAPTMSPLANPTGLPVTIQGYPITVGSGGAATPSPTSVVTDTYNGNPSTFSTITSAGGGFGQANDKPQGGGPGGSGGGGGRTSTTNPGAGNGNTPPVSPPQGQNGASAGASALYFGGGGGGAGAAATPTNGSSASPGGDGSFIADSFIGGCAPSFGEGGGPVGNARYFAGGGGGGAGSGTAPGGLGGGGDGITGCGTAGLANMGAGAGGSGGSGSKAGGSGIVMIRYKFQ